MPTVSDEAAVFTLLDPGRELTGRPRARAHAPTPRPLRAKRHRLAAPPAAAAGRPARVPARASSRDGGTRSVRTPRTTATRTGPSARSPWSSSPGYAPPEWVADEESPPGELRELELPRLLAHDRALLWSAADTDPAEPLPLLARPRRARVRRVLVAAPPARPPRRLRRGAAVPRRAAAAAGRPERDLLGLGPLRPHARRRVAAARSARSTGDRSGWARASGALAALHAHWRDPGIFGGLFLQSGSFFRRRFDSHESALPALRAHHALRLARCAAAAARPSRSR